MVIYCTYVHLKNILDGLKKKKKSSPSPATCFHSRELKSDVVIFGKKNLLNMLIHEYNNNCLGLIAGWSVLLPCQGGVSDPRSGHEKQVGAGTEARK